MKKKQVKTFAASESWPCCTACLMEALQLMIITDKKTSHLHHIFVTYSIQSMSKH